MRSARFAFALLALSSVLGLASCAPQPVTLDLNFPSSKAFLQSFFGRVLVYPLDAENLGQCPDLLESVRAGRLGEPSLDSDAVGICEFRNGGITFDDVPPGPHAYIALVDNESNNTILTGCMVTEVYENGPSVSVQLYPTEAFPDMDVEIPDNLEQFKCGQ